MIITSGDKELLEYSDLGSDIVLSNGQSVKILSDKNFVSNGVVGCAGTLCYFCNRKTHKCEVNLNCQGRFFSRGKIKGRTQEMNLLMEIERNIDLMQEGFQLKVVDIVRSDLDQWSPPYEINLVKEVKLVGVSLPNLSPFNEAKLRKRYKSAFTIVQETEYLKIGVVKRYGWDMVDPRSVVRDKDFLADILLEILSQLRIQCGGKK